MKKKTKDRQAPATTELSVIKKSFSSAMEDLINDADQSEKMNEDDLDTLRALRDRFDTKDTQFVVTITGTAEIEAQDCLDVIGELVESVDDGAWREFIIEQADRIGIGLRDQTRLVEALKEAVGNSPTWYDQMKRDLEYEFPRLFTGGKL
jgi:hypothetical protein